MKIRFICSILLNIIFFLPSYATQISIQDLRNITQETIRGADYVFCVDGGGSKTSLQVIHSKSSEILELELQPEQGDKTKYELIAGPTNINTVGFERTKTTLAGLFDGLKIGSPKQGLSGIKDSVIALVGGFAGLASNPDKIPLLKELVASFGFPLSRIALFSEVDLAKQNIGEQGALLIAGTGSICFSKTLTEEKRSGGLGPVLGDEGSGFYIGKLGYQIAAKEGFNQVATGKEFEKSKSSALTQDICQLLKLDIPSQAIRRFYNKELTPPDKLESSDIAKICPLVFKAAYELEDERCLNIIDINAAALADLVKNAVMNTNLPQFPVYLLGGVFKNVNADDFIEKINQKVGYPHGLQFSNLSADNLALLTIRKITNKIA